MVNLESDNAQKFEPTMKTLALALMLSVPLAGCGASRQMLSTQAQPVIVSPATPNWNIAVGIELKDGIRVRLENRSEEPVSVLWEESAYIDVDQRSHPVMPTSTVPSGRVVRSVIAPGTYLEETLIPVTGSSDNVIDPVLSTEQSGRWWVPFDKEEPLRIGAELEPDHPAFGQQVGLFLVLAREDGRKTVLAKYTLVGTDI